MPNFHCEADPVPDGKATRYAWIDVARGIGITLVIFGHVIISLRDAGIVPSTGYWGAVVFAIYIFHMPVFMFLAGLFVQRRLDHSRGSFLRPMMTTILWPYLLWGSIALLAEWLGRGVRSPVDTSAIDITLLWTPIAWLWFLWALGIYHLLSAVLYRNRAVLLAVGIGAWLCDGAIKLPLFPHQLAHFLIFYACGAAIGRLATERFTTLAN